MQRIVAAIAILFGLVTIVAGGRVLGGADPGYTAFLPLLIYNTAMGVVYVAAGVTIWRSLRWGRNAAGAVFALNLLVFVETVVLNRTGSGVAVESVRAMAFRTAMWLVLFAVTALARASATPRE